MAYFQGRTVELPGSIDLNFYTVLKFRGPENNIRNGFRWQIHFSVACWNLSEYSRSGGLQDQAGLANKKKHPRQRKKKHLLIGIFCALEALSWKKVMTKSTKTCWNTWTKIMKHQQNMWENHPILFVFLCFFLCVLTFPWVLCKASSLIHVFYESKDERKVREIRCWRSRLGESVNWKDVICFCFIYGNTQSLVYLIAGYVTRLFDVSIYFALRTLFSRLVSPPFFAGCTPSH